MRCSRRLFFLGLCFALMVGSGVGRASAQTQKDSDDFARGNTFYAAGKYTQAADAYEGGARRGQFSANLFYNLANAYYRLGDRGRAILNYQRALLLEPAHAEAASNLAFVRGRAAAPPLAAAGGGGVVGGLDSVAALLGADAWTWLATAAVWLGIVGLIAAISRRRLRKIGLTLTLVGWLVGGVAAGAIYWLEGGVRNGARAVVLEDGTRALYSPADNSKIVLNLMVGGEVRVLSEQGPWVYVQLGDGTLGWVSADKIEKVVPPAASQKIL